jgi:CRISPR-associated protein Csc1
MNERLDLNAQGIRLYAGQLYNHDFLWFSSFEISKTAATSPLIHNYALSYAISGYSYGVYVGNTPRYEEDLASMPAYATPARPLGLVSRTRFTQNAVNSRNLRTEAPRGSNSPSIGWRSVLDPVWGDERSPSDSVGFTFYLFARAGFNPPCVIRLGKKGCPVRLEWEEITPTVAVLSQDAICLTHAVNPLDVKGEIVSYDPVAIPPHLILRIANIRKDWFILSEKHRIHVPRRFIAAEAVGVGPRVAISQPKRRGIKKRSSG